VLDCRPAARNQAANKGNAMTEQTRDGAQIDFLVPEISDEDLEASASEGSGKSTWAWLPLPWIPCGS
jgi:hypothetical protein